MHGNWRGRLPGRVVKRVKKVSRNVIYKHRWQELMVSSTLETKVTTELVCNHSRTVTDPRDTLNVPGGLSIA